MPVDTDSARFAGRLVLAAIGLTLCAGIATAAAPVLLFSDLIDGPRTGGDSSRGSQGAYVCIWGKNFGSSQGTSTITVGAAAVGRYVSWADPYPGLPNMNIARACFQLGPNVPVGKSGIHITVGGVQDTRAWDNDSKAWVSTGLPFTVRPDPPTDAIYFIDGDNGNNTAGGHWGHPWKTIEYALTHAPLSSIIYVRQSTQPYTPGQIYHSFGGVAGAWGALAGYPGETPQCGTFTVPWIGSTPQRDSTCAIRDAKGNGAATDYLVYAGLTFRARGVSLERNQAYSRVVGNDIMPIGGTGSAGAVMFTSGSDASNITKGRIQGHMFVAGNYFQRAGYHEMGYQITGIDPTGTYISYTSLDPFGARWSGSDHSIFLDTSEGGTAPTCNSVSDVCVNGVLKSGPPWPEPNICWINDTPDYTTGGGTIQIASCTDKSKPLVLTSIGAGRVFFHPIPNTQAHQLYFQYGVDNIELAWNEFDHNWQGKDGQFYNDTPGTMTTYSPYPEKMQGIFRLEQPALAANHSINPMGPVVTFVDGGSYPQRTYYITWTYQSGTGETVPAHPLPVTVPAGKLISMASPLHNNLDKIAITSKQPMDYTFLHSGTLTGIGGTTGLRGEMCLISIVVDSSSTPDTTITLHDTKADGDTCSPLSDGLNKGTYPWAAGQTFGIRGDPTLAGLYTVYDIPDTTHIRFNSGKPSGTYTASTLGVSKFQDWAYNVYVSTNGRNDWDGWKQNAAPIPNGASWTEPATCSGACAANTSILNTTSPPPSRYGEVPGTVPQSGGYIGTIGPRHVAVHDNIVHDEPRIFFNSLTMDPFDNDILWYNNVIWNTGQYSDGWVFSFGSSPDGPAPVGTIQVFNNTVYNACVANPTAASCAPMGAGGGVYTYQGQKILDTPLMRVDLTNNIFVQPSGGHWISNSPINSMWHGTNNIFYGGSLTGQSDITRSNITVDANTWLDPGLVNPAGLRFQIASKTSTAYGQGTSVAAGLDFAGVPRPLGKRFDAGAYQFPDGTSGSPSACDLNGDNTVSSADIDSAIAHALGTVPCTTGALYQSGQCTVVDVQRVINAVNGLGCVVGK